MHDIQIQALLLIGLLSFLSLIAKRFLSRIQIPYLVFCMLLGFLLSVLDYKWQFSQPVFKEIIQYMAYIGIILLLFDIGLTSKVKKLLGQMHQAGIIFVLNIIATFLTGYLLSFYWFRYSSVTSLVLGAIFCATSVGVTMAIWEDAKKQNTTSGQLLLDVAELDDIAGIVLMSFVIGLLPTLKSEESGLLLNFELWRTIAFVLGGLILLFSLCFVFARYFEHRLFRCAKNLPEPDQPLMIISIGIIIGALAGFLGSSVAIGAFFAGLIFSREKLPKSFQITCGSLKDFFLPFFFINIGLGLTPESMHLGLGIGLVLLLFAALSKFLAGFLPGLFFRGLMPGLLLGLSLIPRAEISLIIVHRAKAISEEIVPETLYSGVVLMVALTCLLTPFLLKPLLKKHA